VKFIFENNRSASDQRVHDVALAEQWSVESVFAGKDISPWLKESERLPWAPVLVSLAFGEGTAFYGFGDRIAEADDLSAKTWLSIHLLDEGRHTEGFSRLLDYLYPSFKGRQDSLLKSKDVYVFYGHTEKSPTLLHWLICTQIAEIFGKHCYRALERAMAEDAVARTFFGNILKDESRHIYYIRRLIDQRRAQMTDRAWKEEIQPFAKGMMLRARNMFEAKRKGANYEAFGTLGISVSEFCDQAQTEIEQVTA